VGKVRETTPFEYQEIDVMMPGQEKWKEVYEFDTPVVCIAQSKGVHEIDGLADPRRQAQGQPRRDNNSSPEIDASIQRRRSRKAY
jgi:hypothetical protein